MNGSSDGSFGYEYLFTDGKWTVRAAGAEQEGTSSHGVNLALDVSDNVFCASIQIPVHENTPSMEETTISSFGNIDPLDRPNIETGADGRSMMARSDLNSTNTNTGAVASQWGDGNRTTCIPEGPFVSENKPAGSRTIIHQHPDTGFDPEVNPFSGRREMHVPERRPKHSAQTPNRDQSHDLERVSNTMDGIPDAKSETDRIRRTVYSADTITRDFIRDAVQHPGITGIAGESGNNIITEEADSKIRDSVGQITSPGRDVFIGETSSRSCDLGNVSAVHQVDRVPVYPPDSDTIPVSYADSEISDIPGNGVPVHHTDSIYTGDCTGSLLVTTGDRTGFVLGTIGDSTGSVLVTTGDRTGSVLGTTGDSTGSVLGTTGDRTGSVLGTTGDSTGSVLGTTGDRTGSVLGTTGDRTGSVLGTTGDRTGSVLGTIGDRTGSVLGTIGDRTGSVLGTIGDRTGSVLGTTGDRTGSVLGTIGDRTGSVLGTIGDSTGSVLGTIGDSTGSVLGTIGDSTGSVLGSTFPVCYLSSDGCPASEMSRTVCHSTAKSSRDAVLVHHPDPESGGMLVDAVPVHHAPSTLGGISEENIHHGDSEPLENILNDAVHREVFDPAGVSAGVPHDATETPRDPSGIAEADVESGSCVLEDPGAGVTGDNRTENNLSVTHSLTSSVPPAPVSHGDSSEETRLTYTDETSHELWVDACAFLSCEVVADAILDECGYCPVSGPPAVTSDNTKPSGSFQKRGTTSGHLELPPIERWSSSDSWASALSDWIQSVTVLPEDSGSKDGVTSRDAPEEKIAAPVGPALDESQGGKVAGRSDGPELRKVDEIRTAGAQNSPEDTSEQKEGVEGTQEATVRGEDSGAPWEVEGGLEEDGGRNGGALSFSGYSSPASAPAPPPQINRHESDSDHLTRVDSDCRQALLVEQCLFSENSDADVPRIDRTPGDSDSIMLLAPVTLGQSFLRSKEEHHESRTPLNPSLTGVGDIGDFLDTSFLTFSSRASDQVSRSHETSCQDPRTKTRPDDASPDTRGPTSPAGDRLVICEENRVACITLDLNDVLGFRRDANDQRRRSDAEMHHRSTKSSKNRDKASQSQNKKQENAKPEAPQPDSGGSKEGAVTLIETIIITEKVAPKSHPKKKKKHIAAKPKEAEPLLQVENGARPKNIKVKSDTDTDVAPAPTPTPNAGAKQHEETAPSKPEPAKEVKTTRNQEPTSTCAPGAQDDDTVKRRRITGERVGTVPVRARPQLPAIFRQRKEEEVVKLKVQPPKEVPCVLTEIEAAPVVDDPQNILLWCRFSSITTESTITWTKEGTVLSEEKKKMGDDGRGSFLVVKASSKDLGLYRCTLTGSHGAVSTPDYHLTSEVLMELVIPDHDAPAECRQLDGEEEDISYAPLLFKDDILTDQYFGERQHTSIVAERDHFGEGMHRKAFRTTVSSGATPSFTPGSSCVLKVHNSIGYGAKDNDELVQKNYNLAVEECYVQNTAREYIKAYTSVAKSADSFGEVPEIIPIFLVHRPSNAVPYATLEEELMGDFVKYSVRDGKEINLMRKDSEAGQKCCAFQHWVYSQTDGNLLVTDMQGVGMKLTDVGIATCKKGYKGFKGNCSTSFIDQFKALHQCNRFCEMLGLASLQPKPRRTAPPKPKPQPGTKKKPFGPTLKGKS